MQLESDINLSNEYYKIKDIAYIYKKPTPIKLVKVDYKKGLINEAYFMTPSTTDYNGIYKGKYIEFDAKETKSKTSFTLNNVHPHQLKHMERIYKHGGICFLIVRFVLLDKTYLLFAKDLLEFINNNDRKSIPLSFFEERCKKIELKYSPRLDYIKIIKECMEK